MRLPWLASQVQGVWWLGWGMTTTAITTKWRVYFQLLTMHSLHLLTKLADCYKNGTCRIVFSGRESLGHCPLAARFYLWNYKMWTGREITTVTSYASQERYPGAVFPYRQQVGKKSNKATVLCTPVHSLGKGTREGE